MADVGSGIQRLEMDRNIIGEMLAVRQIAPPQDDEPLKTSIDNLLLSQEKVVKLMEMSFHIISDFPASSREVRLSASQTLSLHKFIVTVMQEFILAGNQIVTSMIPSITCFIDDGEYGLVEDYMCKIIDEAKEMKGQVENATSRCAQSTEKLQGYIHTMKQTHDDLQKEVQQTKKKEEAQRQARYDALQKLRDNKQRLDEEEAELRKERSAINPKLDRFDEHKSSSSTTTLPSTSTSSKSGGVFSNIRGAFSLKSNNNDQRLAQIRYKLDEITQEKQRNQKKQDNAMEDIKKHDDILKQLNMKDVSKLAEAESNVSDAIRLIKQQADIYLVDLSKYWVDVADVLKALLNKSADGQTFRESLSKDAFAKDMKNAMEEKRKKMDDFVALCSNYVDSYERGPERSIDSMYAFLHQRLDSTSKATREELML